MPARRNARATWVPLSARSGQAMIEMMVGVIVILIVVVGLVQYMAVAGMHRSIDSQIRADTGVTAMSPLTYYDTPSYILNWTVGPDNQPYTADDQVQVGSSATLTTIANKSVLTSDPGEWNEFDSLSHASSLKAVHQDSQPTAALGFVGVCLQQKVDVSSAAQELFYRSPYVTVKEIVWMPATEGLY